MIPCFGIEDWQKSHNVILTPEQIASVGEFPLSCTELVAPCLFYPGMMVHETHYAFVGLDTTSIVELQRLNPRRSDSRFLSYLTGTPYENNRFVLETLKFQWYVLLRDVVPGSENKDFYQQVKMLPSRYRLPSAVEEISKIVLFAKKTGSYPNANRWSRTDSRDSNGCLVSVGMAQRHGVNLTGYYVDHPDPLVGIGAALIV